MDKFEQQLRHQALAAPPENWRTEILEAARQGRTGILPVSERTAPTEPSRSRQTRDTSAEPSSEVVGSMSVSFSDNRARKASAGDSQDTCPTLTARLREWLWPHPAAWASLAAIWLVMLGVHRQTETAIQAELIASRVDPRELLDAFAQQQHATERLLAGLDFESPIIDADRVRPVHRLPPNGPPLMLLTT